MRGSKRILLTALALVLVCALAGAASAPSLALARNVRQQLFKVAVQLGPLLEVEQDGEISLHSQGWGSGTIVSPDGYILTNYHVVDMEELIDQAPYYMTVREGELVVFVTQKVDEPPVPTYIARVLVEDPALDLAVLRIVSTCDGRAINWKKVKLPYCALGDSDELLPLDRLYIFGYPGIGGDTITVVAGEVSGFTAEAGVGNRAWIKTNAAIAGGNSGGTAVDEDGELVGVPTQAGSGAGSHYVDCRPVADTNDDGEIDEYDTCVPIGGFINALRPVNLAKPLIAKAMKGGSQPAPSKTPTPKRDEGVMVMGTILNADTGRPIPGALFLVLEPGITFEDFESDDQLYTGAEADRNGEFILPDPLLRGKTYTLIAGLQGYQPVWEDNVLIARDCDPIVELTVRLRKR